MTLKRCFYTLSFVFFTMATSATHAKSDHIVIFAAASLTNAITDIAMAYEHQHHIPVKTSFASSSALAKQITRGAPADIYIAADQQWMNYLATQRLIQPNSRQDLLKNRLVLISPRKKPLSVNMQKGFPFANHFRGKLCTGQVDSVPVGMYAKQALTYFGWWDSVQARIVGAQNVRTALVYVERGECKAGIVYETDAKLSKKVLIAGTFPAESHAPIRYPMALTNHADKAAADFMHFLLSDTAKKIFKHYGFQPIRHASHGATHD